MTKAISALLVAILLIAFAMMFFDLATDRPRRVCSKLDYDCNLDVYLQDIDRMPPTFARARSVAIEERTALERNLSNVVTFSDDYESTSMLHVLNAYPLPIRNRICRSRPTLARLRGRGARIRDGGQRAEFSALLQDIGCRPVTSGERLPAG